MKLEERLKIKKEELQKIGEQINQTQQMLTNLSQEFLRIDGAIKELEDLLKQQK